MEVTDRRRVTRNRPVELAWSTRRNLLCINDFHPTGRRGRDSAGRGPSLSRCPPGGSLQGKGTAAAAKGRLSVSGSGPLRKQAFDGPETKNSRLLSQPAAVHRLAERARFELAIPFWGTHAFQACLFSHSSISPIRIPGNRDCKGNHFFRKCKCRRLNFSTRDYKVRLWSMQPGYSSG